MTLNDLGRRKKVALKSREHVHPEKICNNRKEGHHSSSGGYAESPPDSRTWNEEERRRRRKNFTLDFTADTEHDRKPRLRVREALTGTIGNAKRRHRAKRNSSPSNSFLGVLRKRNGGSSRLKTPDMPRRRTTLAAAIITTCIITIIITRIGKLLMEEDTGEQGRVPGRRLAATSLLGEEATRTRMQP
ncbi:uncharacterized protein LOC143355338 [Halictus rubicundus]|uniref:uncharacterized protein LOC143355338 n=1 Tax=Halictus rubicundus TaxID=77578 RepID=UPI004035F3AC